MFSSTRVLLEFLIMLGACLCAFAFMFYLADRATDDEEDEVEDQSNDNAQDDPGARRRGSGSGGRKTLDQGRFSLATRDFSDPPQIRSASASSSTPSASSHAFKANLALNSAVKRSTPIRTCSSTSLNMNIPYDMPAAVMASTMQRQASSGSLDAHLPYDTPAAATVAEMRRLASPPSLDAHLPYNMPAATTVAMIRRRASSMSLPSLDAHLPYDARAAATVAKMRRRASLPSLDAHLPYDMPAATTVAEMRRRASSSSLPHMLELEEAAEGDRWREIEKFIIRQPPMGEKDDYDNELEKTMKSQ